jgi:hypothetical protein
MGTRPVFRQRRKKNPIKARSSTITTTGTATWTGSTPWLPGLGFCVARVMMTVGPSTVSMDVLLSSANWTRDRVTFRVVEEVEWEARRSASMVQA